MSRGLLPRARDSRLAGLTEVVRFRKGGNIISLVICDQYFTSDEYTGFSFTQDSRDVRWGASAFVWLTCNPWNGGINSFMTVRRSRGEECEECASEKSLVLDSGVQFILVFLHHIPLPFFSIVSTCTCVNVAELIDHGPTSFILFSKR